MTKKLVKYYADWCMPCKAIDMSLKALNVEYTEINIEDETSDHTVNDVRSIPTLIIFDGENESARLTGAKTKADLQQWLEKNL